MGIAEEIEAALTAAAPAGGRRAITELSRLLAAVAEGRVAQEEAQRRIAGSPQLDGLVSELAGRRIQGAGVQVSFGAANRIGDVQIDTLAGSVVNLTVNVYRGGADPAAAPGQAARGRRWDLVVIATIGAFVVGVIALLPAFGAWLFPDPLQPTPIAAPPPPPTSTSAPPARFRVTIRLETITLRAVPAPELLDGLEEQGVGDIELNIEQAGVKLIWPAEGQPRRMRAGETAEIGRDVALESFGGDEVQLAIVVLEKDPERGNENDLVLREVIRVSPGSPPAGPQLLADQANGNAEITYTVTVEPLP